MAINVQEWRNVDVLNPEFELKRYKHCDRHINRESLPYAQVGEPGFNNVGIADAPVLAVWQKLW